MFQFAFAAAAGVFDKGGGGLPRTVIWLSDGLVPENNRSESEATLAELKKMGVDVRPIIFGKGNPAWARANGLQPRTASGPRELVEAFTDAFTTTMAAGALVALLSGITVAVVGRRERRERAAAREPLEAGEVRAS